MPPELCEKCLKPKKAQAGSLTQWIIICSCDRLTPIESDEITIVRCKTCGKPVREERAGSLTQWIFQRDNCNCDRPVLESEPAITTPTPAAYEESKDEERVELEFESGKFPIDRYGPLEILGEGTSGTVYLSHDRLLKKRVAVKVLKSLDRDALMSFQNEARTTSKLTHPHIVKVLDFGSTDGGVPFMVMELVLGTSLESLLSKKGSLDLETGIKIFIQLTKALVYAHNSGVMHRDLKPSNILIVGAENSIHAYLIDFGVAKLQTYYHTSTVFNGTTMVGTPAYMSPDQAQGLNFDGRSDIYSLGCVMYETFTGSLPFSADSPLELISRHAKQAPPSVLSFLNQTPTTTALADLIDTCLAKAPAQRYQTAEALYEALHTIPLEQSAVESAQTQTLDRKDGSKKPSNIFGQPVFMAVATIGIIALVLIGGTMFNSIGDKKAVSKPIRTKETALKKEIPGAFGTPDLDEQIGKRPSSPMPDVRELTLSNDSDDRLTHLAYDYPNLEKVTILDSNMPATSLRYLSRLPITNLKFETSTVTRQHLVELCKLKALWNLNFGVQNKIDMNAIAELRHSNLTFIKFCFFEINQQVLEDLASIKGLHSITLTHCRGLAQSDITPILKIKELWTLDFSNSDVTDDTLKALPRSAVSSINLSFTKVTSAVFKTLAKSPNLRDITVTYSNGIDEQLVKRFQSETKKRVHLESASSVKGVDAGFLGDIDP